jgi:glucokinase
MSPILVPVLEIGGTHVTGALVDPTTMQVLGGSVVRGGFVDVDSADGILSTITATANSIPAVGNGDRDRRNWGVAIPAPFDYSTGVAWFEGVGKFDSLRGVDLGARLRELVVPSPATVTFVNDADAFVLGEWVGGALQDTRRCAGLTLGTGVGSGFVVDGTVVRDGRGVPPDGSVHRLLIDGRPLEETVSRRAIRGAYAAATGDAEADVDDISERARAGSPEAMGVLARAMRSLGSAVGPWLARFEPELVVIGGAMSRSWALFEPSFAQGCSDVGVAVPRIVVSDSGESAGLRGAAYVAKQR